jgi:hypothetical protein
MGKHQEKLGLKRLLCTSRLTIPNTAATIPNPGYISTDLGLFNSNQASRTPDFSYLCKLSILYPLSSPISLSHLQLYHHRRTQSQVISLYRSMPLSSANTEYSRHRVQHTPNKAYTKFKHTLSTSFTQSCLFSLHDYELTPNSNSTFRHASLQDSLLRAMISMRARR